MAVVGMTQAKKVQTQPWKDPSQSAAPTPQQMAPASAPQAASTPAAASQAASS